MSKENGLVRIYLEVVTPEGYGWAWKMIHLRGSKQKGLEIFAIAMDDGCLWRTVGKEVLCCVKQRFWE